MSQRPLPVKIIGPPGPVGSKQFFTEGEPAGKGIPARVNLDTCDDVLTGDRWLKTGLPDEWTFLYSNVGPPLDISSDPNFKEVSTGPADAGKVAVATATGKIDGSWLPLSTAGSSTIRSDIAFVHDEMTPQKGAERDIQGTFLQFSLGAGPVGVSAASDLVLEGGITRVMFAVLTAPVAIGSLVVTGTIVDRNTGVETPNFVEVIPVNGLTIDASTVNGGGGVVHDFTNGYMTKNWFKGQFTVSTPDLDITELAAYQISYNQFNDQPDAILTTADVRMRTTSAATEAHCHLYSVIVSPVDGTVEIKSIVSLDINAGEAVEDGFYNKKQSHIDQAFNGAAGDGWFGDVTFGGTGQQSFVESWHLIVWGSIGQQVQFSPVLVDWRDVSAPVINGGAAAVLDFAASENVVPILLDQEMDLTVNNLIIDKGILLAIKHSGGPWPFRIGGTLIELLGEANTEEGVLLAVSLHDGSLQVSNVRPPEVVIP